MIAFCRHEAKLAQRTDGVTLRAHLVARAAKGNAFAIRELDGPPFPAALTHLYEWANELHGRSGVGMGGIAPLTYTTLLDWCTLTGRAVAPHEVAALLALDSAMMPPPTET